VKYNPFIGNENAIVFDGEMSPTEVQKQFESIKTKTPTKHRRTVAEFLRDLLA
jgi:predicted RNA-binding protein with PIN domain